MKHTFSPTADGLTEIVFAHRNKNYGAYELRRMYNTRMRQSLLATVAGLALLFFMLLRFSSTNITDVLNDGDNILTMTNEVPTVIPPKPQQSQPSPPTRQRSGFTSDIRVSETDTTTVTVDTTTNHQGVVGKGPIDTTGFTSGRGTKPDTTTEDNEVKMFVENMPEFPGGMDALMTYLSKHINCGTLWREQGESGNVVFSLVVGKDGNVSDVEVLRDGVGYGCAQQAKQVIERMPKWKPGMQGKRPVNVKYILPVTYQKL